MIRIIIIIFSIFYSTLGYAGAWVQEKGHGLNIFTFRRYISDQTWSSSGSLQGSPIYTKSEIDEYLEYGLTEKLTVGLYLSALQSHSASMGVDRGSNNNAILGRYLLWDNQSSVVSVQVFANRLGPAVEFDIPASNSRFNTGEALLFGTGGSGANINQYWFFNALLGLVQRYAAGDQLQLNLEGGWKFEDKNYWFLLQNYNTLNPGNLTAPTGTGYNLITIAPSLVYWITKTVGLQFGVAQDIYGQNVGKGTSPFVASWVQF